MYKIIDSGFTHVTTYQLNMCPGSDMFSPEEISLHGLKGRFRILADCIGTYKLFGNEFAMAEIEKICNETATMSIDDYLSSRKMHLIIDIFYNTFSVSRICPTSEPIFTVVSKFLKNEKNDLEEIVIKFYPQVGKIIDFIENQDDCYFSRITGSGSACIGIFSNMKNAIYAQKLIKLKYPKYWCAVSKTI